MSKNSRLFAVVSYITWIGWFVAFFLRDREDPLVRRHLNQALVINIVESIGALLIRWGGVFGVVGEIVDIACLVLFIMGIVRAVRRSEEPLPLIGGINWIR